MASGIGFVDATIDKNFQKIDVIANYQDTGAKSLHLKILEKIFDTNAVANNNNIELGPKILELDENGQAHCSYLNSPSRIYSLIDLLHHAIPPDYIRDRVVMIGYMGKDSPKLEISWFSRIPIHEIFYKQVLCLLETIK